MIKIPQVFFWKCYSSGKLTCTKTFCFVIFKKECICSTQFYGLVTPTIHSSTLSLKNPKLREQFFSGKRAVPLMRVLLILKIGRGKVTNFSEVTKFFPDENFFRLFFTREGRLNSSHNFSSCYIKLNYFHGNLFFCYIFN